MDFKFNERTYWREDVEELLQIGEHNEELKNIIERVVKAIRNDGKEFHVWQEKDGYFCTLRESVFDDGLDYNDTFELKLDENYNVISYTDCSE